MFKKLNRNVLSLRTNWTSDLCRSPLYTGEIIIQNKEYIAGKIFLIQSFIMVYQKTRVSSTWNTHAFIRMGSIEFKNTSWINRILDKHESGLNTLFLSLCLGEKSCSISKGLIAFPNQQWMKVRPCRFDESNTSV